MIKRVLVSGVGRYIASYITDTYNDTYSSKRLGGAYD